MIQRRESFLRLDATDEVVGVFRGRERCGRVRQIRLVSVRSDYMRSGRSGGVRSAWFGRLGCGR